MSTTNDKKVSVPGVGGEWSALRPSEFPRLFAGGGWQDAEGGTRPDILNTGAANIEVEHSVTTQLGAGSRQIDMPLARMDTERLANANPEFNYSQYKSGGQGPDALTQHSVDLSTTMDGTASGDLVLHVDPREHEHSDMILKLAGIHSMVTQEQLAHGDADPNVSWKPHTTNPFAERQHTHKTDPMTGQTYMEPGRSYEYDVAAPLYTAQQQSRIKNNTATGLRRTNTRKNTGNLMAALAKKKDMYESIDKVVGSLDQEMGLYDKSYVTDQDELLAPSRFKGSEYLASQPGLVNVSRSQHAKYRKSKHVGRMQTVLVRS